MVNPVIDDLRFAGWQDDGSWASDYIACRMGVPEIVNREDEESRAAYYGGDLERIMTAVIGNGYYCTQDNAIDLWESYSEEYCASWMCLPDSQEAIWKAVKRHIGVIL